MKITATRILPALWRLAWLAGATLATVKPGLALGGPGAALEIELARNILATADFGEARLSGTENRVSIRGPSIAAGEGEFRWALDYAYQRYEYEGLPSRNRDLHRLEIPLSWQHDAPLAWTVELRPVIATSSNVFKDFLDRGSRDDLMLHGRWFMEPAPVHGAWRWRAGLARDDVFGEERVYPVVSALRSGDAYRLEIGWPWTRVTRQVGPGLELGASLGPAGARWHVVSDERDGAEFDYEVEAWRAGATLAWRRPAGWFLAASAGLEFSRRHRLEDDLGAIVDRSVDDAGFVEIAGGYRW